MWVRFPPGVPFVDSLIPVLYYMSNIVPPKSHANTTNPKDLVGSTKVSLTKFPAIAILHGAHAMMDGARKYGPYNWRDKEVQAHIYVDAALRHIMSWFEGEELADDSGVHHLGHAIACCAILLDAQATKKLIDDRPVNDRSIGVLQGIMKELQVKIQAKLAAAQVQNGFEISVNGNKVITKKSNLDYKDVCELAGKDPKILHTVTWRRPGGHGGSLCEPDIIPVCPGLILNCMFTGNA